MTALYIHIPFCQSKCPYCSFVSFAGLEIDYDRYLQAVQSEIVFISEKLQRPLLRSVFFGGGTPTFLKSSQISDLLERCRLLFNFDASVEISVEANPGTVDQLYLDDLHRMGVNRISIGIQSLSDMELRILGRSHDRVQALRAFEQAQSAGFENISVDFMYGVPEQTCESWKRSLETILAYYPQHLSCYQLTVEAGTVFSQWEAAGKLRTPDENVIEQMDVLTRDLCQRFGLEQYEISNFAVPGKECRHNINYWLNGDYYAAGAGAVSCIAGKRERREADPLVYCRLMENSQGVIVESERLKNEASFRESVVMGLRMVAGVSCQDLYAHYGLGVDEYYGESLDWLKRNSLIERTPSHLRLTARGRQVANSVMARLV